MLSKRVFPILLGLVAALACARGVAVDESPENRRQRLETMSAAEKEDLLRKKERFENFPPVEQQRLRQLHDQVSTDPEAERLKQVLTRYCEWLKSLSSSQRTELQGLSAEKRIAKIRELKKQQEAGIFNRLVKAQLPREDLETIYAWREDYLARNEQILMDKLPRDAQRWIREEKDPAKRRRRLAMSMGRHVGGYSVAALTQEEEFKGLVGNLKSAEALKALDAAREPEQKRELVQEWLRAAVMAQMNPPVSNEELQRFYAEELDSAKREELEMLPREEMQRELRRLYNWQKFRKQNEAERPPGERPPPDRRGPGPRGSREGGPPLGQPPA